MSDNFFDQFAIQCLHYHLDKACLILGDQTECLELLLVGPNELVCAEKDKVIDAVRRNFGRMVCEEGNLYADRLAAGWVKEGPKEFLAA